MIMDQPVVNYQTEKKSGRSMFGTKAEADEMEALADAWKAMNGESSHVGKSFSLGEFMKGDIASAEPTLT